ncbi:MAG TPA: DUF2332 domain-containing protein [Acidimicrobiia bacterium]|nr:DUF2332 domain-containing protein [Acidimicrobiia bacterium]
MTEPALVGIIRIYQLACSGMGSPFYAALLDRMGADLAGGGPIGRFLSEQLESTYEDAVPLRFLGGVHRLVLAGSAPELAARFPSVGGVGDAAAAWPALLAALDTHEDAIRDALTRPPQTNEVGRSASLVGGFLVVARDTGLPLRVLEVGSSAGLNLRFDRYWYETDGAGYGDAGSPVRFTDLWEDGRPPFDAPVQVAERRGCDRDPIDAGTEDGRLTLLSYVWPGQTQRFTMLRAALDVAADAPVAIDRADIPAWLAERLDEPAPGRATVVFHSITWQYLTDGERATAEAALVTAGARATHDAPLAWLRLEPSADLTHAELRLTTWPAGEERLLAHCHYHLGPMRWVA